MGIQGLLQALKPVTETCHIREYRGRVVGVDAYVWLHRGAYGCAYELCTGGAGASSAYIRYFLSMVDLLLEHGVVPYLVFDGGPLPAKAEQEALRSSRREEATQLALQLQLQGDHAGARNQYVRAVDVNPEMAARVIHTIKQCRPSVKYVVAPYEADAQLSYLFREGIISAVITEDSDTLPYGCKDVLFKLERNGVGQRIVLERIFSTKVPGFDLRGFDQGMFLTMCILSGCDYLPSLPKLGLKKARNLVAKHKIHSRLFRMLKLDGTLPALRADQYEAEFEKAWLTFAHQVVFDVVANATRHLTPVEDEAVRAEYSNDMSFLGTLLDDDVAQAIAAGLMDPITHARFMFDGVCIEFPTSSSSPPPPAAESTSLQRIDSFFKPQQATTATSSSSSSTAQTEGHNKYVGGFRIHSSPDRRSSLVPCDREAGGTDSQLSDHTSVESASTSTSQSSAISSQSLPVTQAPLNVVAQPRRSAFFAAASVSKPTSQGKDDDDDEEEEEEQENYDAAVEASQSQQEKHQFKPLLKARSFISHRHARAAGMRRRHSVTHHGAGKNACSANHDHEQRQNENPNTSIASTTSTTSTTSTQIPTSAGKKRRRHTTSGVLSAAATNQAVAANLQEGDCGALAAALAAQIVPATPDKPRRVGYLDSVSPPTNLFAQYTCDLSLDPPTLPALSGSSPSQPSNGGTSVHSASKKTKKSSTASTASRGKKNQKQKNSPQRSPMKGLNGSAEWLNSTRETVADSDDNDDDDDAAAAPTGAHYDYACDSDGWPKSASPRLKKTRSAPPSLSVRSLDEFRFVAESIESVR